MILLLKHLLLLTLLALPCWTASAQQTPPDTAGCADIVYLRNGSVYRGRLVEQLSDQTLVLRTWSGLTLHLPAKQIRRVVQRCPRDSARRRAAMPKPYTFRERGWYNATTASVLTGRAYWGDYALGYSLHNSTGYAFSRIAGIGVGFGADVYSPYQDDFHQPVYPIFAEARGYLSRRHVAPFYAAGVGWGFAGNSGQDRWGYEDRWRGGWLAQLRVGYRLGNHFTLHAGLRLQRQKRIWTNAWDFSRGQDRILYRRLELGFGLLL